MRSPVPLRPRKGPAALVAALLIGLVGAAAPSAAAIAPGTVPAAVPASFPGLVAAAPQQQTFGIQPASATAPDGRSAYTYSATPGVQVKDHVAVWNYGDQPLSLTLYAADAFNTDTGGYDVLPAGKPSVDVGSWVHMATTTVQLPPRSRQIVPFTLAVPAAAAPGDHSGGIVLALRRQTIDAKGNAVAVDQRVGARIHIRVPGALRPALTVESVHTVYHGTLNPFGTGSTTTEYTVRNTGNLRLGGRQAVRVRNVFGSVVTAKGPDALTELLPGNTATYSVSVAGVFPTLWTTASITVDPLALPGDADPALSSVIHNEQYATVPWTLLALLLPLLYLAYGQFRRVRRRRAGAAGATGGGGGTPPPAPLEPVGPGGPAGVPVPVPTAVPVEPTGVGVTPVPVTVPVPVPVPVPAGQAEPEGDAKAGSGAAVTAVLGLLLLSGLTLGGLTAAAPPAFADPAAPAASASAAGSAGTLAFDYPAGHADDSIDVLTSGPCPHPGDYLMASLSGSGFANGGVIVVGLSPVSIYPVAGNGGYVVPLGNTFRSIAAQNGVTSLKGRYVVDVYCKGRILPTHLKDFPGALNFTADGNWKTEGAAATALIHGSAGTPAPLHPAAPPLTSPNTTAAATSSNKGISSDSVAAMVGGGGLLALVGASYLRRQRAKVAALRARAATGAAVTAATTGPAKERAGKR